MDIILRHIEMLWFHRIEWSGISWSAIAWSTSEMCGVRRIHVGYYYRVSNRNLLLIFNETDCNPCDSTAHWNELTLPISGIKHTVIGHRMNNVWNAPRSIPFTAICVRTMWKLQDLSELEFILSESDRVSLMISCHIGIGNTGIDFCDVVQWGRVVIRTLRKTSGQMNRPQVLSKLEFIISKSEEVMCSMSDELQL